MLPAIYMFRIAGYLMAHRSRLLQQVSEKFHKCINYYSTRSANTCNARKVYRYTRLKRLCKHRFSTFRCHRQPGRSKTVQNILCRRIRDVIMNYNIMFAIAVFVNLIFHSRDLCRTRAVCHGSRATLRGFYKHSMVPNCVPILYEHTGKSSYIGLAAAALV